MRRSVRRLLLCALLLHAIPAGAQVAGRVLGPDGAPLEGATVELWDGQRQLASTVSGGDGLFSFARDASAGATALAAHRLGYGAAHQRVAPPAADVRVSLSPSPVALDGLTATAIPKPCPNREQPDARALWSALYDRYGHATDTLSMAAFSTLASATGPLREVTASELARRGRAWTGTPAHTRRGGVYETTEYPYAYPYYFDSPPAFARWAYRDLQGTDAAHFIEPAFGARHSLSILARRAGEIVIAFCPRAAWKGATMEGTLTLGADTTLVQADWTFRTPAPRENAGGEVVFVPRASAGTPLLPSRGYYWRQLLGRGAGYYQEWKRYQLFQFAPGDTLPTKPDAWLRSSPDR